MERQINVVLTESNAKNLRVLLDRVDVHGAAEALVLVQITLALENAIKESPVDPNPQ